MTSKRLEAMGDRGEKRVARLTGGDRTEKYDPFDVVDFASGIAYEVKTVSQKAIKGSNKIHIETGAWNRKLDFLAEHGLTGMLMVVVYIGPRNVEVYRTELVQHVRISTVIKNGERMS